MSTKYYISHDCLYDTSTACTSILGSKTYRPLSEIVEKYKFIYADGHCSSENIMDGSNCYYAIQDLSNAYSEFYPHYQYANKLATTDLPNARNNLNVSINEYEKQVAAEAEYKNPIKEMYDSSIYTNTLWAVLGTTMLFYVFHRMSKS